MTASPDRFDLDHNATTPVDPRVLARFLEVESRCPGNPGSLHATGRRARAELEDARERLAAALGLAPGDVVFTASGTEANNLAVLGGGEPALPVVLAPVEHPSVAAAAARRGCVWWQVGGDGQARVRDAGAVGLVALVHGQNETGALQPLAAAAAVARARGAWFHVDAAQTLGRVDLAPALELADSVTLSAHKAGGLRGGAALLVPGGPSRLRPLLLGGGQEGGLRPGTPSVALAAATALAVELAVRERPARAAAMAAARDALAGELARLPAVTRLTPEPALALPNTLMVRFDGVRDGRLLLPALDVAGIEASQGSACSSGSPEPPAVLRAMGLDADAARRCVRFSCSPQLTAARARDAANVVGTVVATLARAR